MWFAENLDQEKQPGETEGENGNMEEQAEGSSRKKQDIRWCKH